MIECLLLAAALAGAGPAAAGHRPSDPRFAVLDAFLARAVSRGVLPGGVAVVGRRAGVLHVNAFGQLSPETRGLRTQPNTIYDVASVTKVVVTTTAAIVLVDEGRLDLAAPVAKYFPGFVGSGKGKACVRDLLTHSSGLPAWAPLYREARGREAVLSRIEALDLEYEPGTRSLYSDLGMMLLGAIVEDVADETLDAFARRHIFGPLGMTDTTYGPSDTLLPRIAPTSECRWRARLVRGEVRDENAYAMGGVAGHAGLFSTALDLSRFARMMLGQGALDGKRLIKAETVRRFTGRSAVPGSTRTLGWETPAGDPWSGGPWSASAYGHTGATGTALWIDPEYDLFLVLLTNADPAKEGFRDLRRRVSDLVVAIARGGAE